MTRDSIVPGATSVDHPLARLTATEITRAREILQSAGILRPSTRFVYMGLEEPPKESVWGFRKGTSFDRECRVILLEGDSGAGRDVLVSLTKEEVTRNKVMDASIGQVPLLDSDLTRAEEIVAKSPEWTSVFERRGIDPKQVRTGPMSHGYFGDESEIGRRLVTVTAFMQFDEKDSPWAHPIDDVLAVVDLVSEEIVELVEFDRRAVPQERGEWDAPPHAAPERTTLKPISISQPEGPSFQIENDVLTWENWKVRIGFDAREGLILHQLSFNDRGRERPIVYRASVAEMMVTYGDPSPTRRFINFFDAGEYMFCRNTNSLALGCDCLGEIHYLDVVLCDEYGVPQTIKNGICIHEEDYGILWKHNDLWNGMSEVRRQRRLVISFFTTIGNYDYGFYWYLYLDGAFELEVKATGVVLPSMVPAGGTDYATEVAPNVGAPFHQHMFCVRLDVSIDGLDNFVEEREAARVPVGPDNSLGNAFTRSIRRLRTEKEGARIGNPSTGMVWHIGNPGVANRLGTPVGYELHSNHDPLLLSDESSWGWKRAKFATKHLWVTRYDRSQRYPAGDMVNQSDGHDGLEAFIQADRSIDGADIVLWHTFGLTHFPRTEDWPVMPVDYAGFKMKPYGFFDRNPTLDIPSATGPGCHTSK